MAINEGNRHRLYQRLEAVLGRQETAVLMEHLPPVGWADVATKHDLAALDERIGLRFALVDSRFERVDMRLDQIDKRFGQIDSRFENLETRIDLLRSEFRTSLLAVMSMMVVLVATMIAAVKL